MDPLCGRRIKRAFDAHGEFIGVVVEPLPDEDQADGGAGGGGGGEGGGGGATLPAPVDAATGELPADATFLIKYDDGDTETLLRSEVLECVLPRGVGVNECLFLDGSDLESGNDDEEEGGGVEREGEGECGGGGGGTAAAAVWGVGAADDEATCSRRKSNAILAADHDGSHGADHDAAADHDDDDDDVELELHAGDGGGPSKYIFCFECSKKHARKHGRHNLICFQKTQLDVVSARMAHIENLVQKLQAEKDWDDDDDE
jgi:hypothetical protein